MPYMRPCARKSCQSCPAEGLALREKSDERGESTYPGAETGEDDARAHYERASERDELEVVIAANKRVDEDATAPGEPASECANEGHQGVLAFGIFNICVRGSIKFL